MTHQQTIQKAVTVSGVEFHTGQQSTIRLIPHSPGSGITIRVGNTIADMNIANLVEAHRSTTSICVGNNIISSVEHLLSALFGMGISNLGIQIVRGTEIPIFDGSSKPWVELIKRAGIKKQQAISVPKKLIRAVEFQHGQSQYSLEPSDDFEAIVEIDFPKTIIGRQTATFSRNSNTSYDEDIAPARTFIGDGADGKLLDRQKILNRLKSVDINEPENCPCILYEQMRYITPLQFENEPAAHKLLDFMGDFALLGNNIVCEVKATRPTHRANQLLAKKLSDKGLIQ